MHTAKKRICFFQVRFLMLSILFSDQGKECREVSSFSLRCTVGIQEIRVAAGAEVRGEDIFFTYAAGEEVLVAGFPEV